MEFHSFWLGLALVGALVFPVMRLLGYWPIRPLIKAVMGISLAIYCLVTPDTPLYFMALGFALSAIGDYCLDLPNDSGFTFGLFAFFAAHAAFIAHLQTLMVPLHHFTFTEYIIVVLMVGLSVWFFLWLRPALEKPLVIPVALYSAVIAVMGIAALATTRSSLIIFGALLFIASDVVLSIEKFKFKFNFAKEINWALYASGQILLAIGAVLSVHYMDKILGT